LIGPVSSTSPLLPLAVTRYCFTSRLMCTNQSSFIAPPPSTRTAHTIVLLLHDLRNLRPPTDPPFCMPYTIQYWSWQYRVKTNPPPRCSIIITFTTYLYILLAQSLLRPHSSLWPLQDIVLLRGSCARINPLLLPPPLQPALPTLVYYFCTTIAQSTTPRVKG